MEVAVKVGRNFTESLYSINMDRKSGRVLMGVRLSNEIDEITDEVDEVVATEIRFGTRRFGTRRGVVDGAIATSVCQVKSELILIIQ